MLFSTSNIVSGLLLASSAIASPIVSVIEERDIEGRAVPVGQLIAKCTVPGTIALTFDDGPYLFTQGVMNRLRDNNMKATFFVNGQNIDTITNRLPAIQRMINDGHQIGSHTWSHPYLTQISNAEVITQMTRLEDTLFSMVGKVPTYMRPPYFDANQQVLNTLGGLGYKVIHASIDTLDWQYNEQGNYKTAVDNFRNQLNAGGNLALMHDIHWGTNNLILPEVIQIVKQRGLRAVTVGECLGDPIANWYRGKRNGGGSTSTPTPAPSGQVDPNGTCGGDKKFVCASGLCCSQYGWCGTTSDHCGAGCNPVFGKCN